MTNFNWHKGGSSDGRQGYIITFDYDIEKIKLLKETVPAHLREWNPDKRQWWIHEYCEKAINDLFPGFLEAVTSPFMAFTWVPFCSWNLDVD